MHNLSPCDKARRLFLLSDGDPAGLLDYLANETPSSADGARDTGPDRYEPPVEGVLLERGLIEPVGLEVVPAFSLQHLRVESVFH